MDKHADPATRLTEVYQAFYVDLTKEGTKALGHPTDSATTSVGSKSGSTTPVIP